MGRGVRAPLLLSAIALLLAALPYIAGFLAAPRDMVFLGALNNVGDTGQYLTAIRQGMGTLTGAGQLLYVNQYSSLRAAPVLMYPFYTVAGFALAPLRLPVMATYQLVHLLAAVALLAALWRFCRVVRPSSPALCHALALLGGGLYAPALLLSGVVRLPFAPVALTAPEFSVFATLLISPHGAAGLAAQLWALAGYLEWRRHGRTRDLLALAAGALALGLCYPFGIVVLLAVVAADAALRVVLARRDGPATTGAGQTTATKDAQARHGELQGACAADRVRHVSVRGLRGLPCNCSRGLRREALLAFALLPACGIALYYAMLFHRDPLWGGSNMLRLPPPSVAVVAAAFGPLLLLACPALTSRKSKVKVERRRLFLSTFTFDFRLREGDAGLRLAATWAVATPLLLLAPLPQTERLLNGWGVALAVLGAVTLRRLRARAVVRAVAALSLSNVMLALLYLAVTVHGANPAYYAPADEDRAVRWLAAHTGPRDVVMASAGSGNLIVAAAPCHVVAGQNFQTFDWAAAQRDVLDFYAPTTGRARRAAIVRRDHVTLVVAGPYERAVGRYAPGLESYRLVHRDGAVRVFAVVRV